MKLDFMFLADSAQTRDGLLYVLGGQFDTVYAERAPVSFAGVLVARIAVEDGGPDPGDEPLGDRALEVHVRDEQGESEWVVGGSMRIGSVPQPAWDPGFFVLVKLDGLPLPSIGFYRLGLRIDGEEIGSLRFRVLPLAERGKQKAATHEGTLSGRKVDPTIRPKRRPKRRR